MVYDAEWKDKKLAIYRLPFKNVYAVTAYFQTVYFTAWIRWFMMRNGRIRNWQSKQPGILGFPELFLVQNLKGGKEFTTLQLTAPTVLSLNTCFQYMFSQTTVVWAQFFFSCNGLSPFSCSICFICKSVSSGKNLLEPNWNCETTQKKNLCDRHTQTLFHGMV